MNTTPHPATPLFRDAGPEFENLVSCFEAIARTWTKSQLIARLWVLEPRLGTRAEQPLDFAEARAIAHQLNNLRTAECLRTG